MLLENLDQLKFMDSHNHCQTSNFRLYDCIVKEEALVDYAITLGHEGVCLTDHESISGHIKIMSYVETLHSQKKLLKLKRQKGISNEDLLKEFTNIELLDKMSNNFKLGLGNEIYLINSIDEAREGIDDNKPKFWHFILIAKDKFGHRQLREISSSAWKNSFSSNNMERVPTLKCELENIIGENKGHLVASSACLGSEISDNILKILNTTDESKIKMYKQNIHNFINWCINIFGKEDFYIELQPSNTYEQIEVNKMALIIAKAYGLKAIITTDTHYLKKEHANIHAAYLNSQDGEREVADFYSSTYMMSVSEIYEYMHNYISDEDFTSMINNTIDIHSKLTDYTLKQNVVVPEVTPPTINLKHTFHLWYENCDYIKKFACSDSKQDLYLLSLIEDGFISKKEEFNEENIHRINIELKEMWDISTILNQRISSYYNLTKKVVDIIWSDNGGNSLVGVARGSVTGFYTAFLIDITQLNPIKWNLPHWRHLVAQRPELPDIDIDSEASKRQGIFTAMKNFFGFDNVLNIITFKTEGSKSATLTACRGLNIDNDIAQSIADLIPFERGANWSLSDCFDGNEEKERKPVKEFINLVEQHEELKETMLAIEGLICGRSIHASGVYIFSNGYIEQNSLMKAPNGSYVTAWNMTDSDLCGSLKIDCLTIEALDKMRTNMELLIQSNKIEWQGNLRATYTKYLHPEVLDYTTQEMWDLIGNNELIDAFQFDTAVGSQAAAKVKPITLPEMAAANSLMRLMGEKDQDQPVDIFVRYKNDISLWYMEMRDFGLNETEIKILEKHLLCVYGVADTQEIVMELSMDKNITGFDIIGANKLRKGIAKKSSKVIKQAKKDFFEAGKKLGTRKVMLDYVWNVQISRQLGYSFSKNHTFPYSVICIQEMNLAYYYGRLFWNTACLTVNAGADENNEDNKSTNYGKIASAIGNIKQRGVQITLPDINKANFGFIPDETNNAIIFGMKGISGLGDDVTHAIIENRPFDSFKHFVMKMVAYKNAPVSQLQTIQLIKAGSFDNLIGEMNRQELLLSYVQTIAETKSNLKMSNIEMLIEYECIPEKYNIHIRFYRFRKYIFNKQFIYKLDEKFKSKTHYKLNDISIKFFNQYFIDKLTENKDYYYNDEGDLIVIDTQFDSVYEKEIAILKTYITTDKNVLNTLNQKLIDKQIEKHMKGSISKWEMDSLCFYYTEHELQNINFDSQSLVDFNNIDETPLIIKTSVGKNGKEYKQFKIFRIIGTVLDKDKMKHTISLLTPTGVVTVKFYGGAFAHYDKQLSEKLDNDKKKVIEKSWFKRGNKLLITGFRREQQFVPRKYQDSIYQNTVCLVTDVYENGEIQLQQKRKEVD